MFLLLTLASICTLGTKTTDIKERFQKLSHFNPGMGLKLGYSWVSPIKNNCGSSGAYVFYIYGSSNLSPWHQNHKYSQNLPHLYPCLRLILGVFRFLSPNDCDSSGVHVIFYIYYNLNLKINMHWIAAWYADAIFCICGQPKTQILPSWGT